MKTNVFLGPGKFGMEVRVRLTTICGTDIHIARGEYPAPSGLTIRHEAVGVIHELGAGVTGYDFGRRVLVGAITPRGQCEPFLSGHFRPSAHAHLSARNRNEFPKE